MKLRLMLPKKKTKLRATAARRVAQPREIDEYDDDEPTMKLSKAFFVVLLLHVIAVGGIYMFNSIKAHRPSVVDEIEAKSSPAPVLEQQDAKPAVVASNKTSNKATSSSAVLTSSQQSTAATSTAAACGTVARNSDSTPDVPRNLEAPAKPHVSSAPRDSGIIHVVTKGENPVGIARKLGVGYNDLLKLNNITDPKRLQIGQKLHVPVKSTVKNIVEPKASTTTASANTYIGS